MLADLKWPVSFSLVFFSLFQKFRLGGAVAIELQEKLSDHDLETILNIWNRKPCRISI